MQDVTDMPKLAEHIVTGYDEDLNALSSTVAQLGGLVESMVSDAIKAIKKRDSQLAMSVVERDKQANALQEKVDDDAMRIFALRHPMATDLRRVIGAVKVATDLERIGDLAESMARRAQQLNEEEAVKIAKGVSRMGKLVKHQLKEALDALMTDNVSKAGQVWLADDDVDEMYDSLFRELLTYMMEDPRKITRCTSLLFAAKNLERIGDHATNIAESVHFTVTGQPLTDDLTRWEEPEL